MKRVTVTVVGFCLGCVILCLSATLAAAQQPSVAPIVELKVTPEQRVLNSVWNKPMVLKSQDQAAKHFGKEALATIASKVNFEKQVLLVFAWPGSQGDQFEYRVLEPFAERFLFRLQFGTDSNYRYHSRVFALRTGVKWMEDENLDSSVKLAQTLNGPRRDLAEIHSLQFSACGKYLLSSGFFGTLLWDLDSGKILKKHSTGGMACFGRDEKHIFIGSTRRPLTRVDARWESVEAEPHMATIECMAVSPDGDYLLCGGATKHQNQSPGYLSLWNLKEGGKHVRTIEGDLLRVKAVEFLPGFRAISVDGTMRLWDLAEGKELRRAGKPVSFDEMQSVPLAVFRDGRSYTTGYYQSEVDGFASKRRLDLTQSQQSVRPTCVAISPDQKMVAVGNREALVRLWDAKTGEILESFNANPIRARLNCIAFSPDGRFIATAGEGSNLGQPHSDFTIKIWKNPLVD